MDIYNVIIMDRGIRHCILLRVFLRSLFWKDFGGQRSWKYMFLFLLRFHCYEYKTHWHIALFCFPEMSALLPRGVWIRNILCYPETRVPLKGSISENACIGPVGAEFRWAWRVSIISSISLFFAICTLFPWNTYISSPCSEIECAECNSVCAPLGVV